MTLNALVLKLKASKYYRIFVDPATLLQFIKYIITGLSAAGLEYLLFYILIRTNNSLYLSNSAGMTAGFILSFLLNRYWSFQSKSNAFRQFSLYLTLFIVNLGISNTLIHVLSKNLGILPLISKVIIMAMMILWNFILYRKVIYK